MPYINREISWLSFNGRVLQEAKDTKVPLIERLRFLGIFSNNLDEFFRVRYATIRRICHLKPDKAKIKALGYNPFDLLKSINEIVKQQQNEFDVLFEKIIKDLKKENIEILNETNLNEQQKSFVVNFYFEKLSPALMILIPNKLGKFPQLKDDSFYLIVKLKLASKSIRYALIEVPTSTLSRYIILPSSDNQKCLMYLEDVIRYNLNEIFSLYDFVDIEAHAIKITRDSELNIDNDVSKSFLDKVSDSVLNRRSQEPVRLVYDKTISDDTLKFLKDKMELNQEDSLISGGRYHNRRDLLKFPNLGDSKLEYSKQKPIPVLGLEKVSNYFEKISKRDYLLYFPYHSFSHVTRLLRQAAVDPEVKKISITIYRVAEDSQLMYALINAARNGKEVVAVVELQARFDEAHNIKWAKKLESEGVTVIFDIPGLKVHSKICLIERANKADGLPKMFGFMGTGNFNESTAKRYTDYLLMTSNKAILKEIKNVFEFFDVNYKTINSDHLLVSPFNTRTGLIERIDKEIKLAKKGKKAAINFKMNSFSDSKMMKKIYEAANEGVEVRLIVRGICSYSPTADIKHENIRIISVIDKFLEHPRMYWFRNGGKNDIFISSADLLTRNLDYRVEVSCPIYDPFLKEEIIDVFEIYFKDNQKARIISSEVENEYNRKGKITVRSQEEIQKYYLKRLWMQNREGLEK